MALDFNVQETFLIAEKIESNGKKFYIKAAEVVDNENVREFLVYLADMEERHEKDFCKMKKEFFQKHHEEDVIDINSITLHFLKEVANGNIFNISDNVEDIISKDSTVEEIFKIAIENEKNSVVFYEAIRESSLNTYWKREIQKIINEELKHIIELSEWLKKYKK